jgi:phosphoenolpyruvate carboxykinase (GTP)
MEPPVNTIDISKKIGKISSVEDARLVFEKKIDKNNLSKLLQIKHPDILIKIANAIVMCNPDTIFINTGTDEDMKHVRNLSLKNKEESPLAIDNHTIHFDLKEEQGRIINRTFYIADQDEDINSLANKMDRIKALDEIKNKMVNIMQGKTMIIGFYMRGPVGSPVSNPALEITSSAYVSHSADILYRNVFSHFEKEVSRLGYFFTNIHSQGLNRSEDLPHARVFMDRKDQTTYCFNCTYAGNTLLLKKGNHRFAVDKAVYKNRGNEASEHMFITGIEGPDKRVTWCTGAAPSGCGKTTTAMAGDHFVGDDLAQMWINENGSIRAINPETGIFGIVEDVNQEGDPILMNLLRNPGTEIIWSNVLIDEKRTPHWSGNGEEHPAKGINFQGVWEQGKTDENGKPVPISHPNARVTLSSTALANYSQLAEAPEGVETKVITYSGRDNDTMPPVRVARTSYEGVVIGASIVSAATATEVGAKGVNRSPWANSQFIPGSLGDYMDSQFKFFCNKKIKKNNQPIMAGLNYFLTDENRGGKSKKLLGEKKDVKVWLSWLERLAHNEVDVIETPIGNIPKYEDLKNLFQEKINKTYSRELYNRQFSLYIDNIVARIDLQTDAYKKEKTIPNILFEIYQKQKKELLQLKNKIGPIVTPDNL